MVEKLDQSLHRAAENRREGVVEKGRREERLKVSWGEVEASPRRLGAKAVVPGHGDQRLVDALTEKIRNIEADVTDLERAAGRLFGRPLGEGLTRRKPGREPGGERAVPEGLQRVSA